MFPRHTPYIAAGWYTPDYEHWFRRLERSLIEWGAPYDFLAAPKLPGGWEANTCRKPGFIMEAIHRHDGKTIIWIDVDAMIIGDPSELIGLPCDVALRLHGRRKRHRTTLIPRAGTIVINPTEAAKRLIGAWAEQARFRKFGDNDETALTLALTAVHGISIINLDETAGGVIQHSFASADQEKLTRWDRFTHQISKWLGSATDPVKDTVLLCPPRPEGES